MAFITKSQINQRFRLRMTSVLLGSSVLWDWRIVCSSPDPGHVSFCYHWASVVRPSSSVVNLLHFNFLLWNHWANLDQTWMGWSLGGPLSELYPMTPSTNRNGKMCWVCQGLHFIQLDQSHPMALYKSYYPWFVILLRFWLISRKP